MTESESQTRRNRIDSRLRSLGWEIIPYSANLALERLQEHVVTEFETTNGPADYAFAVDGQLVGVLEAKKLSLGPQNVLSQAERYARGLPATPFDFDGLKVPFLWSTNGEVVWFHDVRHPLNASRQVSGLPTPNALREGLTRHLEDACRRLIALPNDHPRLRPYQREANTATEKALDNRSRRMLLAMATGTGKTFVMVNQVYRLMKSDAARRVLFLVDRRVLAAQAVRAFASFEPEPGLKFTSIYEVYSQRFRRDDWGEDEPFDPSVLPSAYLLDPQPKHAFVYVCTIQRMAMNLFGRDTAIHAGDEPIEEEEDERLDIPLHAFDVVIADECHRGYTAAELSAWRKTLEHFDAINIGLTATPAAHTTAYFKNIVYRYEYERAVREGYLVDYDAVRVKSGARIDGVFLKEGEHVGLIDPTKGTQQFDILEDERQFDASQVEHDITVPESNRKIIEEMKRYALEHEQRYGRFPKTLIFAANDLPHVSHADQLITAWKVALWMATHEFSTGHYVVGGDSVVYSLDVKKLLQAEQDASKAAHQLSGAKGPAAYHVSIADTPTELAPRAARQSGCSLVGFEAPLVLAYLIEAGGITAHLWPRGTKPAPANNLTRDLLCPPCDPMATGFDDCRVWTSRLQDAFAWIQAEYPSLGITQQHQQLLFA